MVNLQSWLSQFSCPVIAVREFACHQMSGDNAIFFPSTRLCGLMMTKFWRPDCVGFWEQIKGKYSIAWAPWWFVGTRLIARKLSENRLNLEMISTMISPTKHTLNLVLFIKKKSNILRKVFNFSWDIWIYLKFSLSWLFAIPSVR